MPRHHSDSNKEDAPSPWMGGAASCPPDCYFRAEISQPSALKLLAENINNVLKTVDLLIVKNDRFEGIRIETLDDAKVCVVVAKLPCTVHVSPEWASLAPEHQSVCVSLEWLLLTLRQVELQYSLIIDHLKCDEGTLRLRYYEPLTGVDEFQADIYTLATNAPSIIEMQGFPVKFKIEMDLQTLRNFLKSCESIKSDDVEFLVKDFTVEDDELTLPTQQCSKNSENSKSSKTPHLRTVTVRAKEQGSMGIKRTFRGIVDEGRLDDETEKFEEASKVSSREGSEEGSKEGCSPKDDHHDDIVSPPPKRQKLQIQKLKEEHGTTIFQESFSTKYLNSFVRSMNRTNVTLHMSPQHPLHVSYSLGPRDAHVTFILAPKEIF